jgi:hypothetical protein
VATKRRPINRPQRTRFTPDVLEAFRRLKGTRTQENWWKAHNILHNALRCQPWQWPCVEPPDADRNYEPRPEAVALWRQLDQSLADTKL